MVKTDDSVLIASVATEVKAAFNKSVCPYNGNKSEAKKIGMGMMESFTRVKTFQNDENGVSALVAITESSSL